MYIAPQLRPRAGTDESYVWWKLEQAEIVQHDELQKLRRKVEYSRGLRKIRAEAELVEALARDNNEEALAIGRDAAERARNLLLRAAERNTETAEYKRNLAHVLRALAYALLPAKQPDAVRAAVDEARRIFDELDDIRELVRCHEIGCMLCRNENRLTDALRELERALELGESIKYYDRAPIIHAGRADMYRRLNQVDRSLDAAEAGLRIARALGDDYAEEVLLSESARTFDQSGRPRQALERFAEAVALERRRRVLDGWNRVTQIYDYAILSLYLGRLSEAATLLDEAVNEAGEAHFELLQALYLVTLAGVNIYCADYLAGINNLQRAQDIYLRGKDNSMPAWCTARIGSLFNRAGLTDAATEYFNHSRDLLEAAGKPRVLEQSYHRACIVLLVQHGYTAFDSSWYLQEVNARLDGFDGNQRAMSILMQVHARAHLLEAVGRSEDARRDFALLLDRFVELDYPYHECSIRLQIGRLLMQNGDMPTARPHLEKALRLAREQGSHDVRMRVHCLLAACCDDAGLLTEAAEHRMQEERLRRTFLAPSLVAQLQLWRERDINRRLQQQTQDLNTQLNRLQSDHAAAKRLLESRDANLTHLKDALKQFAAEITPDDGESEQAYRLRAAQIAQSMTLLADAEEWANFGEDVKQQDEEFLSRLARAYPTLTATERKICALMRLNNTTKDLGRLLNISPRSVQAYRYRIRKKLSIPSDADFNASILAILYPDN